MKMRYVRLRIDQLEDNPVQPEVRTEDKALAGLTRKIEYTKTIAPVIVCHVDRKYVVADGHRRKAAALKLGEEEIDAAVITGGPLKDDPVLAFTSLNQNTWRVSGKEWFVVWSKMSKRGRAAKDNGIQKDALADIRKIERLVGTAEAESYARAGISPNIVAVVTGFVSDVKTIAVDNNHSVTIDEAKVLRYMVEQGNVQRMMKEWAADMKKLGLHKRTLRMLLDYAIKAIVDGEHFSSANRLKNEVSSRKKK